MHKITNWQNKYFIIHLYHMFTYFFEILLYNYLYLVYAMLMHSFYIYIFDDINYLKMKKNSSNCNIISSNLTIASFFSVPFSRCIKKCFLFFISFTILILTSPSLIVMESHSGVRFGFENFEKCPPKNNNKFQ